MRKNLTNLTITPVSVGLTSVLQKETRLVDCVDQMVGTDFTGNLEMRVPSLSLVFAPGT